MMRLSLIAAALLSGCTAIQQSADIVARQEARRVVNTEVQRIAPGSNVSLLTDCVINGASAQEILIIATGPAGGGANAATMIGTILQRPAVQQCAAGAVISGLL